MGVPGGFLAGLEGFEWDSGNSEKNWRHHQVRQGEAEQALLNRPVVLADDVKHSQVEVRFLALGRSDSGRHLAIVFTARGAHVRVISARPMSRAERRIYGEAEKKAQANS